MTEPLVIEYAPGVSVDITKPLAEGRPVVVLGGGGGGGRDSAKVLRDMARQEWAKRYEHDAFFNAVADELDELTADRDSAIATMLAIREQREKYAEQVCLLRDALQDHGIHIEAKWCWCGPTIENHTDEVTK